MTLVAPSTLRYLFAKKFDYHCPNVKTTFADLLGVSTVVEESTDIIIQVETPTGAIIHTGSYELCTKLRDVGRELLDSDHVKNYFEKNPMMRYGTFVEMFFGKNYDQGGLNLDKTVASFGTKKVVLTQIFTQDYVEQFKDKMFHSQKTSPDGKFTVYHSCKNRLTIKNTYGRELYHFHYHPFTNPVRGYYVGNRYLCIIKHSGKITFLPMPGYKHTLKRQYFKLYNRHFGIYIDHCNFVDGILTVSCHNPSVKRNFTFYINAMTGKATLTPFVRKVDQYEYDGPD